MKSWITGSTLTKSGHGLRGLMDEPTYIFKKGEGWIVSLNPGWESLLNQPWIYLSSFSTGPDHSDGNWYMYPETCKNWNIIDCLGKDLKVGDVIPYGPSEYRYVLGVTP